MELAKQCVAAMGHSRLLLRLGVVALRSLHGSTTGGHDISTRCHTLITLPHSPSAASSSRSTEAAWADGGPKFTGGQRSVLQIYGASFHGACRRVGGLGCACTCAAERSPCTPLRAHLIALSLTDGWTAISTLHGQAHDCFALFETTHADDAATPAKMSLLAARARLDDLVIGMPHTRYR